MQKEARIYTIKIILQCILGLLLFLLGSHFKIDERGIIYFFIYFAMAIVSSFIIYKINAETLGYRNKIKSNAPLWDKILASLLWFLMFYLIYFIAGVESINSKTIGVLFMLGIILQFLSSFLTLWALIFNTYLESTSRIQRDRNQKVIKVGPYKIIRHPTYAAILVWCLAISLIFTTKNVIITAIVIGVITIIRTILEDNMLKKELEGYYEYTKEVKYRIIPFIW
ncbi:methyltransferase family protein [Miniphocaeibacter halophilus]|uniref:Isoprenylcysteine carboxylmethyltransferase family protein n=1 Tax=Miniphocaeibacter halophilus TaxID=2931922 RepID=A0AC61MMH0_9FIRM|nr:isoprenylcysteine carboxylmethyltransferase family protein [Miniphocaeibacter halophilus]QQK06894.1 isoprenylcysteine carboxylmethyltransferase family protein [Miniphocaeibacter halophilus]